MGATCQAVGTGENRWVPPYLILLFYLLLLVSCGSQGGTGIGVPGGQSRNAEPATASGDPTVATGGVTTPVDDMTRADILQNILAWLASDPV